MYKGLRIFLLALLLPAFLASATGIQVTRHVCQQCQLVEFSLDGTSSVDCCKPAEEALSCCSLPEQKEVESHSCCSTQVPETDEGDTHGAQVNFMGSCCQLSNHYLVTDTVISTPQLLLAFFKSSFSQKTDVHLLSEDDQSTAFLQFIPLRKNAGRDLLVTIQQLKLDC